MKKVILVFLLLFVVLCIVFTGIGVIFPDVSENMVASAGQSFSRFVGLDSLNLTVAIFNNNLISSLIVSFSSCYLFGIPILIFLLVNTALIGAFLSLYPEFVIGLIPHGVIEIPAICIALALGWHIWRRQERTWKKIHMQDIAYFLKTVVPLLMIAAIVEVYITPLIFAHFSP